ncbi:MAG: hypothetical protein FVQ83_04005 [Chloroflexi bacterium]|nr:hypothetical protein [Chloroflexota bacterium]
MQKRLLILMTLVLLNLTACQSEIQSETATQEPVPSAIGGIPYAPQPNCTVSSPQPTPGPTQQSIFPAVSEQDWALGPETASLTIIEYGDFQ